MPIKDYFGGHGEEVMSNTQSQYGKKEGKSIFYALANKRKKSRKKKVRDYMNEDDNE